MTRTFAAVKAATRIRAAAMRRRRNQVDQLDAAFVMTCGLSDTNALNGSAVSTAKSGNDSSTCLKVVHEDAKLALTDDEQLSSET